MFEAQRHAIRMMQIENEVVEALLDQPLDDGGIQASIKGAHARSMSRIQEIKDSRAMAMAMEDCLTLRSVSIPLPPQATELLVHLATATPILDDARKAFDEARRIRRRIHWRSFQVNEAREKFRMGYGPNWIAKMEERIQRCATLTLHDWRDRQEWDAVGRDIPSLDLLRLRPLRKTFKDTKAAWERMSARAGDTCPAHVKRRDEATVKQICDKYLT